MINLGKNMSKSNTVNVLQEEQEYKQVKRDLWTVIILNAIFFAALISLYFWNRNSGIVEEMFEKIIKL